MKILALLISSLLLHSALSAGNLQELKKLQEGVSKWMQKRDRIPQETASNESDMSEEEEDEATIQETSLKKPKAKRKLRKKSSRKFIERPGIAAEPKEPRKYITKPVPKEIAPVVTLLEEAQPNITVSIPSFPIEESPPVKKVWVSKRPSAQLYFRITP